MCLHLKENDTLKTAEKDITCYKLLSKDGTEYYSYHFMYHWVLGELRNITEEEEPMFMNEKGDEYSHLRFIHNGFHSFICKEDILKCFELNFHDKWHWHDHNNKNTTCIIAEFVIPKGSLYWEGKSNGMINSYCSNQIIFNSICV